MNNPVLTIFVSCAAMTFIVGVRYLITSGAFAWVTNRRFPSLYNDKASQIRREIGWSLASAAIYGAPAGFAAWLWDQWGWTLVYTDVRNYPIWYIPISFLLFLLAHDCWFYWTHRVMHKPYWFKKAHAVHHESKPPTAWAAMSFHPWEALTGAIVIPALVFIIPIHISALAAVLTVMTIMGISNHIGWEMFPKAVVHGPLGKWLITATHHQHHHDLYRGNYGLYFRFWDKMCGTDLGLGRFQHDRATTSDGAIIGSR
jgi:Delta7-sterol 5-desaturase